MKAIKMLAVLLVIAVVLSISAGVFAEGDVYTFGIDGQKVETQGVNGWYYMYSPNINQGENFDTTTFKECIQGLDTWAAWDGKKVWIPNETTDKDGNTIDWMDNKWFRIENTDGWLRSAFQYTAGAKWVAQKDGNYKVTVELVDTGSPADAVNSNTGDGITYSIYKETTRLLSGTTGQEIVNKTLEQDVALKAGEALYFISDPNEFDWDNSVWKITIALVADAQPAAGDTKTENSTDAAAETETPKSANPGTGDAGIAASLILLAASGVSLAALKRRK